MFSSPGRLVQIAARSEIISNQSSKRQYTAVFPWLAANITSDQDLTTLMQIQPLGLLIFIDEYL